MTTKTLPEYLKLSADGSYIDITLSRPIDVDGTQVTVLRMREPLVADQETAMDMAGTDAAREVMLFANLCEITPDQIRKLPLKNHKRLQEAYTNFTS